MTKVERYAPMIPTLVAASLWLGGCSPSSRDWGHDDQQEPTANGGSDAGSEAMACEPATCTSLAAECGTIEDGCGATLQCGACLDGQTCGLYVENRCGGQEAGAQATPDGGTEDAAAEASPTDAAAEASILLECDATTTNNCTLQAAASGDLVMGSCTGGTTGACSFNCTNGMWIQSSNTCQAPAAPCPATTLDNCSVQQTDSGGVAAGTCANGTNGTCSYACLNGLWTVDSNSCTTPSPCPATTLDNCTLNQSSSGGGSIVGSCVGGTVGSCDYYCNNGSWSESNNTCTFPTCGSSGYLDTIEYECPVGYYGKVTEQCQASGWVTLSDTCTAPTNVSNGELVHFVGRNEGVEIGSYLTPLTFYNANGSYDISYILSASRSVRMLVQRSCPNTTYSHVFAPSYTSSDGICTGTAVSQSFSSIDDGSLMYDCTYTIMLNWTNDASQSTVTQHYASGNYFDIYTGSGAAMALMTVQYLP